MEAVDDPKEEVKILPRKEILDVVKDLAEKYTVGPLDLTKEKESRDVKSDALKVTKAHLEVLRKSESPGKQTQKTIQALRNEMWWAEDENRWQPLIKRLKAMAEDYQSADRGEEDEELESIGKVIFNIAETVENIF